MFRNSVKTGVIEHGGHENRIASLLLAAVLAACDGPRAEDYRLFVEEDGLLIPSVEAVLAFPVASRELRS